MDSGTSASAGARGKVIIDQSDMFTHVFAVFEEHKVRTHTDGYLHVDLGILLGIIIIGAS